MEVVMEFKKCRRCGAFFASSNEVCSCWQTRDEQDLYRLNNFIDNSGVSLSVANLSAGTGISEKNINRFIANKSFDFEV